VAQNIIFAWDKNYRARASAKNVQLKGGGEGYTFSGHQREMWVKGRNSNGLFAASHQKDITHIACRI